MFIDFIEAIASCLDRESARRIVKLDLAEMIERHAPEADARQRSGDPKRDAIMRQVLDYCAIEFFSLLQRKARAVLRRPAASEDSKS